MTFDSLLIHSADVLIPTTQNVSGRVTTTWTKAGTIKCRFTQYNPSRLFVNQAAAENIVDAVVFANPEFIELSQNSLVRLSTSDSGWSGTYEMKTHARIVNDKDTVHHVEISVVRVSA